MAYFEHVNPLAPVINRTDFLEAFSNNTASPLLLFAIFTAGCKACKSPMLLDQSGTKFATGLKFWKTTKVCAPTPTHAIPAWPHLVLTTIYRQYWTLGLKKARLLISRHISSSPGGGTKRMMVAKTCEDARSTPSTLRKALA